ncbi:GNAT family N-acetyltransferase [Fimbriiglobus ruber]|uniref:Putative n-terminal acetyltransferase n=1 Tax=Fimbriiglobus ruber TaxID=1908690 RepID=A0A225DYA6_9BACT|nr:N-acetyltransferase [Fimbriiglobus ruber]OWK46351.1 putative n-terminal acetyltransferase [Fimbriiglobus ruber]
MTPRPTYFKRYWMECDLGRPLPPPVLPAGFFWVPWSDTLVDAHALVKYHSFRDELDSQVFPSLGHLAGCRELMRAIRYRDEFCPRATWLVATPEGWAGTVQGLRDGSRSGAIQNVGVVPEHRGQGIGEALLLRALQGFHDAGFTRAHLEVTAQNDHAVRLYRKHGFRSCRTLYKPVELPAAVSVGMGI